MAARVELAVVAKNQASKVLKQVGTDIRGLGTEAGKSKGALGDMFSVAGGNLLARGIQSATSAMIGLGKAAIGALGDMVSASAGMNAQVSGIGAVLGLTADELVKVKGLINELGVDPNLKVNAQEAADAIDMLARNGLTLDQIMGGAARATVFLANATGGTFDTSANVATDVMAMFKIRAEDMMTAVDGITSVTVASKFDIDDYRLAIAQAGGVASALGVEFDDFNTSIAATSSSFASGSDAGTSYKTFLQRLVPQSDEAAAAMAELGLYSFNSQKAMAELQKAGVKPLSTDMNTLIGQLMKTYAATHKVNLGTEEGLAQFNDWAKETGFVQNSFYDANGQLKDMASISSTLSQATAGLTEEQKNQYLTQIFGSDAMRTAFGLAEKGQVVYTDVAKAAKELGVSQEDLAKYAEGGITAFEALQATMGKTDALKGAQMRMDNLAGDMEIFSGIVDSVKIQIGDKFDPVLRNVFQGLTATFTQLMPQILAFGDVVANNVTAAIGRLSNAFAIFQSGGSFTDIGAALGISPALLDLISFAAQNIDILVGALGGIATVIGGSAIISGIAAAIGTLLSPMTLVIAGAALLGIAWNTNFGGIQEKTQAVIDFLRPGFEELMSWITAAAGGDFSGLQAGLQGALDAVSATIESFSWADFVTALSDWGAYIGKLAWDNAIIPALDWAAYVGQLAWDNAIVPALDWAAYIAPLAWDAIVTTLGDWGAYIVSLDWAAYINTAIDWATYIAPLAWDTIVATLGDWGTYITSLDWTTIITTAIDWATWIPALSWTAFITSLEWGTYAVAITWSAFISALDWMTATGGGIDWAGFIDMLTWDNVVKVIAWADYITTFAWNSFVTNLEWTGVIAKLDGWSNYVTSIDWTGFITSLDWTAIITTTIDWATWIVALPWNTFVKVLEWTAFLGAFAWTNYITKIDWSTTVSTLTWDNFITAMSDWGTYIASLPWADYIIAIDDWGKFIAAITWSSFVANLDWPSFVPTVSWSSIIPAFPGWDAVLDYAKSLIPGSGMVSNAASSVGGAISDFFSPDTNADGTKNFEGGWTWVGERGPELLNLPKGSEILSNTESKKMIGGLADGTTTAAATAPRQNTNVFSAIANAANQFAQSSKELSKSFKESTKDLEASLRKVPGLFGTSQVTDQQMKMAELGIPQNFADDWIRRLTDEVVNGVDWEGVDIKDAALRAGLDPSLPADAILELVKEQWNNSSFFAGGKNTELINQDAVKDVLAQQAAQQSGQAAIMQMFGITPEQAQAVGLSTGTAAGAGLLTGVTTSLTGGNTGTQIATAIGTGVTPESMAPVGTTIVSGLTAELQKDEYSAQMGTALSALFTGYLDKADAFADVAQRIMARITSQFGNITGLDIVAKFTDAFRTQLDADDAIASLGRVGEKILELVFRGYLAAAQERNWAEGVNAKSDTSTQSNATTTTTTPELLSSPGRSRIFAGAESMALAGAGGGGGVVVNNYFTINNDVDAQSVAYQVVDIIRRRR